MSFQNNNNYTTAPTFPNSYISRKLNNMDQAQVMKRERRLDKTILQDIERNRGDDRCAKASKGFEENS